MTLIGDSLEHCADPLDHRSYYSASCYVANRPFISIRFPTIIHNL